LSWSSSRCGLQSSTFSDRRLWTLAATARARKCTLSCSPRDVCGQQTKPRGEEVLRGILQFDHGSAATHLQEISTDDELQTTKRFLRPSNSTRCGL
jgi:hypothetical protein